MGGGFDIRKSQIPTPPPLFPGKEEVEDNIEKCININCYVNYEHLIILCVQNHNFICLNYA